MASIPGVNWQDYKDIVNAFHNEAFQDDLIWYKETTLFNRNGEDDEITYTPISLKVLFQYNYFRSWPLAEETASGELDIQSLTCFINKKYLSDLGYLNADGYWDFNPSADYFETHGIRYRAKGDTHVSQASDDPLLFMLNLQREETETGDPAR